MDYQKGYVYHIKDEYFTKANDPNLMQNKENGNYRPTFYCMRDEKTSLLWLVPLSSRVEKFPFHSKMLLNKINIDYKSPNYHPQILSLKTALCTDCFPHSM